LASGDHACLGFDSDEARWEIRAAFAEAGFFRGEQVMFFTDPGTSAQEAVARLSRHGLPAGPAIRDGRLVVINDVPGYDPGLGFDPDARAATWVEAADNALREGFMSVRAVGDMSWTMRPGVDHDQLVGYEASLTPLFAGIGFTAICEYDRRLFPAELIGRVTAAHPVSLLHRLDALHLTRSESTLRVAGDADLATREEFDCGLRRALGEAAPPSLLDLSALSFIDAHCATTVVRLASGLSPGARLTVRCQPMHARTLRLCGATEVPQLVLSVRRSRGFGEDDRSVMLSAMCTNSPVCTVPV